MRDYLRGMKILDFTRLIPGPYATQILADLGADVIKVEAIDGGDYARQLPPQIAGVGTMFVAFNRNKKSLGVNLKSEYGREIVKRLIKSYDIIIEGFRSGVMERLGLGYTELAKINPSLIYLSLTGYGHKGPYAKRAAHDINCLALAGISAAITDRSGRPVIPDLQIADMSAGLFSVIAILAAQQKRHSKGVGSFIDLSMTDSVLSLMSFVATDTQAVKHLSVQPERMLCGELICYNYYETRDGRFMAVGAIEPQFWLETCRVLELPAMLGEAYTNAKDDNPFFRMVTNTFKSKTQNEWIEAFKDVDACVEPVLNHDEVIDNPIFIERNMIREILAEGARRDVMIDTPIDPQPDDNSTHIPRVGEDCAQILPLLGFSDKEIEEMSSAGAILISAR